MSRQLEALIARILVDAEARARFFADPHGEGARQGLCADELDGIASVDRVGFELAAASINHKSAGRTIKRPESSLRAQLSRRVHH